MSAYFCHAPEEAVRVVVLGNAVTASGDVCPNCRSTVVATSALVPFLAAMKQCFLRLFEDQFIETKRHKSLTFCNCMLLNQTVPEAIERAFTVDVVSTDKYVFEPPENSNYC